MKIFLRSFTYTYWEDYTPAQVEALRVLVNDIAAHWNIPVDGAAIFWGTTASIKR